MVGEKNSLFKIFFLFKKTYNYPAEFQSLQSTLGPHFVFQPIKLLSAMNSSLFYDIHFQLTFMFHRF